MICLGLVLGSRTCGLGMIDLTNFIASPFKTLKWDGENYDLLFVELDTIIKDYGITDLVLGLPKNMNNTLGFASERSLKFKEALENRYQLKVTLIDERLSTVEAENYLISADMSRKKRKKVIDGVAASLILDTYLKMKGD